MAISLSKFSAGPWASRRIYIRPRWTFRYVSRDKYLFIERFQRRAFSPAVDKKKTFHRAVMRYLENNRRPPGGPNTPRQIFVGNLSPQVVSRSLIPVDLSSLRIYTACLVISNEERKNMRTFEIYLPFSYYGRGKTIEFIGERAIRRRVYALTRFTEHFLFSPGKITLQGVKRRARGIYFNTLCRIFAFIRK